VPIGVELVVVMDKLEEPAPVTAAGVKLGVTPDGNPVTLKLTLPANPFVPAILRV